MNILFLTNKSSYFKNTHGGAESSIRLLAEKLAECGDRVFYVTRKKNRTLNLSIEARQISGVNVRAVSFLNRLVRFGWVKAFQESIVKSVVRRIIAAEGIQIVYCFYELNNLRILKELQGEGLSFRIVMRMAGMLWYEECLRDRNKIKQYERVFNEIDSVNYIHPNLASMVHGRLKELKMRARFRHEFSGDIGTSAPIGRRISHDATHKTVFTLLMASRFSKYQKRQDILVDAMALIDRSFPIRLVLAGNGARVTEIKNRVSSLGLTGRIEIVPFLAQEALWKKLNEVDMLCHASEYEGLGKVIIESMAVGLPVLVSDVSPLNGYIKDGVNGFLVANSPRKWAAKIVELYQNRKLPAQASKRAIEYVREHYNPENNVQIYRNAFSELLSLGGHNAQ